MTSLTVCLTIICNSVGVNPSGPFAEFCTHLVVKVPALHLWAAAVQRYVTPDCLCEETVTTPVRCPPAIDAQVGRSVLINDRHVHRYTGRPTPAPTDGPAVRVIRHWDGSWSTLSPGHTGRWPRDCERCADDIAHLMEELRVGQLGCDLQHRDTIILCDNPRDNLPVVTRLRERGLPVQVVTSDDDEAVIRDVALAMREAVTVTDSNVVLGLERRLVVVMGGWRDSLDRLQAMSRCNSLLVWVGQPL